MNYKTINKSQFNLRSYSISKNIPHNRISKNSLNLSKYFSKVWKFISSAIFNNTEYAYDRNAFNSKSCNNNYTIQDPTEITLISSRRTFL
ncbi:hypothetical protein [Clostridium uliginosum]|uniref:Uncharacterized protein n=1 Tax=Clostridium uliginosum TaxID=119641 RepID=A0A1I1JV96_9CLOT|nr:hypothetical protein [Clostridium uliginosum]SFC51902.1 hypothetical protein SAMN05421842_104166 [Clostridium uliginosum]